MYLCSVSVMADFYIYIPLESYLSQWFVNRHGGVNPVKLRRGCAESDILEVFLTQPPSGYVPAPCPEGSVPVIIPAYKYKPAHVYNYLPPAAVDAFVHEVRKQFDVELWSDLFRFGNIGRRRDNLIYAWMEAHGIEATDRNWNAIAKRYQRKRKWTLANTKKAKKSV